jgi:D-amino-acid oxidase
MQKLLVLGAGVSGLTTGIMLLEHGYDITIWAKDFPPHTTSNHAGAFWYPYLTSHKDTVVRWAEHTADYVRRELLSDPASGCVTRTTTELFQSTRPEPWWEDAFPSFHHARTALPDGYTDSYQIEGILMDTTIYLDYLVKRFRRAGGRLQERSISSLEEPLAHFDIVVNCTGLGARELCHDDRLYPIRGQMVRVRPNGFDQIIFDDEGPNSLGLIVPRVHDIVLGGTTQENDWNTAVDPADTAAILARCARLSPLFKHVDVIDEFVGLRPARDQVRLEIELRPAGKVIIHNYGHGGAGYTLSWGCAMDVMHLVRAYHKYRPKFVPRASTAQP